MLTLETTDLLRHGREMPAPEMHQTRDTACAAVPWRAAAAGSGYSTEMFIFGNSGHTCLIPAT